ncbi:MobA/MobL family protein [Methylorubrum zatmanii]|nr:MobA/MobL family protein [Methylobacteriaceae bacterium AG10]
MPNITGTHCFVREAITRLCGTANGLGTLQTERDRELAYRLYAQPGIRFATRESRERPISPSGAVTCHLSQTAISKTSPILKMIRAAKTGRRMSKSYACAHQEYIDRPGAAERLPRAIGGSVGGRGGAEQQAYVERAGAVEADRHGGTTLSSFGTLGDTAEQRAHFWEVVESTERSPAGDRVTVKPGENPSWWTQALAAIDEAPPVVQAVLREAGARRTAPLKLKLSTQDAFAFWRWAETVGEHAPIDIAPGRGGRTQTRIIAELPFELDGHARHAIVCAFTEKLKQRGFPFWAVVHAPDANNDQRNFHCHIVYYDRPARRIPHPDTGAPTWDFAITRTKRRANRTTVLERPHRQRKDRDCHERAWIKDLRTDWGTCCNAVLAEVGLGKRVDLRSYKELGIDRTPGKHIPARQYNKERKGGLTAAGADLARQQWDTEADLILTERAAATGITISLMLANGRQAEIMQVGRQTPVAYGTIEGPADHVRALTRRGLELIMEIGQLELARDLARLVFGRTISRPRLLLATNEAQGKRETAKAAPLHSGVTDPAVREGHSFGFSRRSELVEFFDRLEQGHERLAAAYDAQIVELRRQLGLKRAELLHYVGAADRVQATDVASRSPARVGGGDADAVVERPTGYVLPIEAVPASTFRDQVRASLDRSAVALWDRVTAVEPGRNDAAVAKLSRPAISLGRSPIVVPATLDTPAQSPGGAEASPTSSWANAVSQAAKQRGRELDDAARRSFRATSPSVGGFPAVLGGLGTSQLRPYHELASGLAYRRTSNGAPLIHPPTPATTSSPAERPPVAASVASQLPATGSTNTAVGQPTSAAHSPGPKSDRPATPVGATPAAPELIGTKAEVSSSRSPPPPPTAAPKPAPVASPPDERSVAQAAVHAADPQTVQANAGSESRELLPPAGATAPAEVEAIASVRAGSPGPRSLNPTLHPSELDPVQDCGAEPQSEIPSLIREHVAAWPPIASDQHDDLPAMKDQPRSEPSLLAASERAVDASRTAVRVAPPPASSTETPPPSVPAWAVKGVKGAAMSKDEGVRPSLTSSRNGRGGRGGRGIGD